MTYKSLLTILTEAATVAPVLEAAAEFAARSDAHLDVLSLGLDRSQIGYSYIGGAAVLAEVAMERAEADAQALDAAARVVLTRQDARWAAEAAVAQMGGMADLVSLRARYCDLAILPRPYGPGRDGQGAAVVEASLFEGRAPALILPDGTGVPAPGGNVVVAWNQSREAMTAVRGALPFLKAAREVSIAVVDPQPWGPERSDPGGLLCQYLVRHGVNAEVSVLAKTLPDVADVLVRHLRDRDAGLLVMGAYSHSRLREAILGGATRHMLEKAEVPMLMAH
jgi:nucleotide-binding universal stress UspA family protein